VTHAVATNYMTQQQQTIAQIKFLSNDSALQLENSHVFVPILPNNHQKREHAHYSNTSKPTLEETKK